MQITLAREEFLKPLMLVSGAIERKHTLPILSNVLIQVSAGQMTMTGTDMELELIAAVAVNSAAEGAITVPAKKMLDILRSLPDAPVTLTMQGNNAVLASGNSKFTLATLPAADYPNLESWQGDVVVSLSRKELRLLLEGSYFSMANQDVRYYLNGMSFEFEPALIRTIATDGHRLALTQVAAQIAVDSSKQIIVPRKGVLEIMRLLADDDAQVELHIGSNHIRLVDGQFTFTSKLVDGRFPDYRRVLPRGGDKVMTANREWLKNAFARASILSNEKFRGVRLNLDSGRLQITANNPEQEQAEEIVDVNYQGGSLEIGFNVSYLLDVLNALKTEDVAFTLSDGNSSVLIDGVGYQASTYVVMPMRL